MRIRALSQLPEKTEGLVPLPTVHRIVAIIIFHGSLVVALERIDSPQGPHLLHCFLPHHLPPFPPHSSVAGGGTAASSPLRSLSELSAPDLALIVRAAVDFVTAAVFPCDPPLTRIAGVLQRRSVSRLLLRHLGQQLRGRHHRRAGHEPHHAAYGFHGHQHQSPA